MAIDADLNGKQIPQRPGSRSAKLRVLERIATKKDKNKYKQEIQK